MPKDEGVAKLFAGLHLVFAIVLALTIALLTALPAQAQPLMTAEEFDSYTLGKTLFYGRSGAPYGAEIYHENRRVQWSFLDGECKEGRWYEEAGMICFVYEDNPTPQCWTFEQTDRGLRALFNGREDSTELYEAEQTDDPMTCLGPEVGV